MLQDMVYTFSRGHRRSVRQGCRWLLSLVCAATLAYADATRPNVLLVLADDCTWSDLEVHGGQARTPRLNRLAAEGMRFTRCFQAAPMCSPTRHCLYTGMYPVKSGAYPNHTEVYPWVKSLAGLLQEAGYRTYLSGKSHVGPKAVFPFTGSRLADDPDPNPCPRAFEAALAERAENGRPFLFVAASNEPHLPWNKGDPAAYPLASLTLPPSWVDTPQTRAAYARYLAEVTYFDGQVGTLLDVLDRSAFRDDTLVIVLSEQGSSFPFAKWTCYDAGLRSACLVRWPGRVRPGSVSDALVEYVDVTPTVLAAAGLPQPEILDGRSFLPVLREEAQSHKQHVFGIMTARGIKHGPEHYGSRSARDARYLYIRNLTPEAEFRNAATLDPVFRSWEQQAADGDAWAQERVVRYRRRPPEELYDCESDPWNLTNRIGEAALAGVREVLRERLDVWMRQQGDEGQATEERALERMPRAERKAAAPGRRLAERNLRNTNGGR